MGKQRLSYSQMQSISEKLGSHSNTMGTYLNEVKALLDKVGSEDVWSGTAAASAKEEFDALSAKFPEFSAAVLDCKTYLGNVIAEYREREEKIKAQLQQ